MFRGDMRGTKHTSHGVRVRAKRVRKRSAISKEMRVISFEAEGLACGSGHLHHAGDLIDLVQEIV